MLVFLLPLVLLPVGVDREIEFTASTLSAASVLSSAPLFNIYMRPLSEAICWFGVRYPQYKDDLQLYIFTPGSPSDVVNILS